MSARVRGKSALVTGAVRRRESGAPPLRRWRARARVLLTDLNGKGALVAARVIDAELGVGTAFAICHDVTSGADWKAAIAYAGEALRGLSVLINNAGIAQLGQSA
jgi:NAD(P)-dependent dehydrogenase (short-subunit alcohol dehydrogenase family)